MNRFRSVFLLLVLFVSVLLIIDQAGALSIRELLGLDDKQEPAKASTKDSSDEKQDTAKSPETAKQDWAKTREVRPANSLGFADIQKIFANLNAGQRQSYLKDASTFRQFVKQEAGNLSILEAAISNNVDEDENTRYLMKRGAENVLRESYLKKLMASKIPKDFPTDQQLREYYDKNKEQFVIEQRIQVWQVYLQIDQDMDKKALASLQKKASTIIKEIQQGKLDFATAAIKYSEHAQSKANGGYMGLLKVSELKPEITKPLLALAEGKISQAIKTNSGFGSRDPESEDSAVFLPVTVNVTLGKLGAGADIGHGERGVASIPLDGSSESVLRIDPARVTSIKEDRDLGMVKVWFHGDRLYVILEGDGRELTA